MKPKLVGDKEANNIEIAKQFRIEFNPQDKDYDWIYLYAKELFNKVNNNVDYLDNKADCMIKYLAPVVGLLGSLIALLNIKEGNIILSILMLIGIGFIIGSICISVNILLATDFALPPTIKTAIKRAEEFSTSNQAKAKFSTSINVATTQNISVIEYKSRQLNIAYKLFTFGVAWIFLMVPIYEIIRLFYCHLEPCFF